MDPLDLKLSGIDRRMLELEAEKYVLIDKAMKSENPINIVRASMEMQKLHTPEGARSYILDMSSIADADGYRDRATDLTFDTLRIMAKTPVIRGIIGTRLAQITNFSTVTTDDNSVGWRIRKKRRVFGNKKDSDLSIQEKARIEYITEFIQCCGDPDTMKYQGDNFQTFLQKFAKDSLEIDQATFEIVRNRRGNPVHFFATDGATYRYARHYDDMDRVPEEERPIKINGQYPEYVQIYESRIFTDFYKWELCFGIRNKATDVDLNGYGVSELEDLVRLVTWMLNADTYNGKFFSQGAAPKGILAISGNVNQSTLTAFRNNWQSMVAGVQNAWKTPVLEGDKISWIDLQKSNQDMQFMQWGEYLIRTACAVFKIDPSEVGLLVTGSAAGGSGMPQYTSVNQKVNYSKDKGLYPLLQFIQEKINDYVVSCLDPEYEFAWTGLSPEDEAGILDMDIKKLTNFQTINEIREKRGLPPIKGGDIILNPSFLQSQQASAMGNPDSNEFIDGMDAEQGGGQGDQGDGGYDWAAENNKDTTSDEAWKSLASWIQKGMPVDEIKYAKRP